MQQRIWVDMYDFFISSIRHCEYFELFLSLQLLSLMKQKHLYHKEITMWCESLLAAWNVDYIPWMAPEGTHLSADFCQSAGIDFVLTFL